MTTTRPTRLVGGVFAHARGVATGVVIGSLTLGSATIGAVVSW